MKNLVLAATLAATPLAGAAVADPMITKTSPHSVAETIDRLATAVEGAGAKIFARVDHAEGAKSVDMELRPTQMLMFGNPKLGTPAMQAQQTIGLDLPLRVLAYQTEDGSVLLTYENPADMAKSHGADSDMEVISKMSGALDKLTNSAIAE
ncbi:DUF302 domain-containing protein [Neptunicoccus sediminis]|uniref:DUF302 domain-containing protein n=1 Tax=Neptunicoccus sediminis TaxID=1892596 RepID=UPI001C12AA54